MPKQKKKGSLEEEVEELKKRVKKVEKRLNSVTVAIIREAVVNSIRFDPKIRRQIS